MERLTKSQIDKKLKLLAGWEINDGFLVKNFVFKDFDEAFNFLNKVALIANELDHHPDWSGIYNKVSLKLKTHDFEHLTEKDFLFAEKLEML